MLHSSSFISDVSVRNRQLRQLIQPPTIDFSSRLVGVHLSTIRQGMWVKGFLYFLANEFPRFLIT